MSKEIQLTRVLSILNEYVLNMVHHSDELMLQRKQEDYAPMLASTILVLAQRTKLVIEDPEAANLFETAAIAMYALSLIFAQGEKNPRIGSEINAWLDRSEAKVTERREEYESKSN